MAPSLFSYYSIVFPALRVFYAGNCEIEGIVSGCEFAERLFGFTSFLKNTIMPATLSAFVFSPVLAAGMFGVKGVLFSTFICFVPRILVGIIPYFIYKGMKKFSKWKSLNFAVAGVIGAFTNTFLVMGSIYILYKDAYAAAQGIDPAMVLGVIGGIIGFNGVIEAVLSGVIVSAVGIVLNKIKPIR